MQQLVHTECLADAMDFKFSAGVGGKDNQPSCVDEDQGCPTEAYILCGFQSIGASQEARVDFLACMDDGDGDAGARANACAARQDLDATAIEGCATGQQGSELLQQAHEYYEANRAKVRGFPTLLVNDKEPWTRDWETVVKTICDAGVECACNLPPPPTPAPAPTPAPPTPSPSPAPVPSPTPVPVPTPLPSPLPPVPVPTPSHDGDCFSQDTEDDCQQTTQQGQACKWCASGWCFEPDVDCPQQPFSV